MSQELFSHVLLVEDEPAHAALIGRALKGLVGEVLHANRGTAGIQTISTQMVDLVLCDLNLPDMTALQMLDQTRTLRPGLPFVVLTSSNDLENAVSAMRSGASDYMVKSAAGELRGRLELVLQRLADEERRRNDELTLRSERDAFWTAAHATTDGLAILSADGRIIFENRAFHALHKSVDPEGRISGVVDLVNVINPSVSAALHQALDGEGESALWRGEISISVPSDSGSVTRYFELIVNSVAPPQIESLGIAESTLQGLKRVILWSKDITGRKEQERMNRDLLATTTHDLKGPLGAIINSVELLEQMIPEKEAKVDDLLTRISGCSRNCISLIDELLSVRRIQDGVFVVRPKWIELGEELEDMVLDYLPMAKSRGIQFGSRLITPTKIYADTIALRRVMGNLVNNALKFTPSGGHVELSAEGDENEVRISVSDTGPGIDKELQHTLFEKYGRLDRDQAIEGTGLGLFVTKNIVDAHSGRVEVKSALGKGTTFIITFPNPDTPLA